MKTFFLISGIWAWIIILFTLLWTTYWSYRARTMKDDDHDDYNDPAFYA